MSTIGAFEGRPDEDLAGVVKAELEPWFGPSVKEWQLLRNYRIPYAQPNQVQIFGADFMEQYITVHHKLLGLAMPKLSALSLQPWISNKHTPRRVFLEYLSCTYSWVGSITQYSSRNEGLFIDSSHSTWPSVFYIYPSIFAGIEVSSFEKFRFSGIARCMNLAECGGRD